MADKSVYRGPLNEAFAEAAAKGIREGEARAARQKHADLLEERKAKKVQKGLRPPQSAKEKLITLYDTMESWKDSAAADDLFAEIKDLQAELKNNVQNSLRNSSEAVGLKDRVQNSLWDSPEAIGLKDRVQNSLGDSPEAVGLKDTVQNSLGNSLELTPEGVKQNLSKPEIGSAKIPINPKAPPLPLRPPSGDMLEIIEHTGKSMLESIEGLAEDGAKDLREAGTEFLENPSEVTATKLNKVATELTSGTTLKKASGLKTKLILGAVTASGLAAYYLADRKPAEPVEPVKPTPTPEGKEDGDKPVNPKLVLSRVPEGQLPYKEQKAVQDANADLTKSLSAKQEVQYLDAAGETKRMPLGDYLRDAYRQQQEAIATAIDVYKQEASDNRKAQIFKSLVEGIAELANGAYGLKNADRGVIVKDLRFDPMPWLDRTDEIKQNLSSSIAQAKGITEIADKNKSLSDEELTKKIQSQNVLVRAAEFNLAEKKYALEKGAQVTRENVGITNQELGHNFQANEIDARAAAKGESHETKYLVQEAATAISQAITDKDKAKAVADYAKVTGDMNAQKLWNKAKEIADKKTTFFTSDSDIQAAIPAALAVIHPDLSQAPAKAALSREDKLKLLRGDN